jgi:uncharacterized protein
MQLEQIDVLDTIISSKPLMSIEQRINKVCQTIAPLWSLENFVAVNPYLGNTDKEFETVAQELAYILEIDSTMSIDYYLDKIKQNEIIESDIEKALNSNLKSATKNIAVFMQSLQNKENKNNKLPVIGTAIEKASEITNKDWQRFATQRISLWLASYFDKGQVQLSSLNNERLFISWKKEALVDKTPEIAGLSGFKNHLNNIPNNPIEAIKYNLCALGLNGPEASFYLERVLMNLNGWAGYAAKLDYEAKLDNLESTIVLEVLAVLTSWELCTFLALKSESLTEKWKETVTNFKKIKATKIYSDEIQKKIILQEALNFSVQ